MEFIKFGGLDFMGSFITPIVAHDAKGYVPLVVIAFPGDDVHGTGALGCFGSRERAYRCAIEYGKTEVLKHFHFTPES
ncbi:hypothetical protein AWB81_07056 [Caballeronia arationis]|uniref:hypothetical protein n=1 Tax=Caballeronia arationis TaxID=1777142 RepID=UPI00074D271B|nr:hypothetical protein [Caballeronia arationis]SAL05188.1 hypothetical protein AWB81_07056 [Caballeronia arationis]